MSHPEVTIQIFDTTLRDGAQALPAEHQFEPGSKPEIADAIAQLGVTTIEAGFPATQSDFEEVTEVARTVGQRAYQNNRWSNVRAVNSVRLVPVIAGLSRASESEVETCWDAVQGAMRPRIHTFIPTDAAHMEAKFPGKSAEEIYDMGMRAVKHAVAISSEYPAASVEFSAEAASTTEPAWLERIVKGAVNNGADIINVPDTVGERTPSSMRRLYGNVIAWAHAINPDVVISAHNHNDLGNAVANTITLVEMAIEAAIANQAKVNIQLEATIGGLGERAGNADVFPVMANIFKIAPDMVDVDINWLFNPDSSVATANFVMGQARLSVGRQSPVVGPDTNVHRSGIHSDGVIKGGHRIYTPHDPTFWGHGVNAVHEDGKYQGRRGREAAQ